MSCRPIKPEERKLFDYAFDDDAHEESMNCWCHPEIEIINGNRIIIHKSDEERKKQ